MRPSIWAWCLFASLFPPSFGAAVDNAPSGQLSRLAKRDGSEDAASEDTSTVFNGVTVPALKELPAVGFEEAIKDGYWFVKHYSPSCPYCKAIEPTWQTLYEYYYTSNPVLVPSKQHPDSKATPDTFEEYYDFHFASMNCQANADKCKSLNIRAFPSFVLYRNGEEVETFTGKKSMKTLSEFIEQKLNMIRPRSRPRGGITLPEPGAKEAVMAPLVDQSNVDDEATPDGETSDPGNTTGAKSKGVEKPRRPLNPQGRSIPLTAESFLRLVTTTRDPWFIKFYAPWCAHCQALGPAWQQMAKEMKGKINIGEVNCETERRLCKDAGVNSYPTMYVFRGAERVEYNGLRGLGDLIHYAQKAADAINNGVQYVDAAAFKALEETEPVIFLYFFDEAAVSEDFIALDRLILPLIGRAKLVKTDSPILAERFKIWTYPRLMVSREGRASYYTPLAPKDMRDYYQILDWMRSVWLPLVPELTPLNAREIMEGKYVVLGILNRHRSDEFIQDQRELKNAALEWMDKQTKLFQLERQELRDAKELRIEEATDRNDQRALRAAKNTHITIKESDKKQVVFAWVDGIFWDRWIRTTYGVDVRNGERVIINDEEFRRYWDLSPNGAYIMPSRTSILETLSQIYSSPTKIKPKSTIGFFEGIFFSIRTFTFSHPYVSAILFFIAFAVTLFVVKSRLPRSRGVFGGSGSRGFFHLDGKEGLLGASSSGQGKVD
ncbi:hypothetical protein VTO42DRAFT_6114 [Malbranchea cinnamomea]